ncbi:MAG TPA: hypothetical protein VIH90_07800 [Candidatus Saccharimonadales bacterium]
MSDTPERPTDDSAPATAELTLVVTDQERPAEEPLSRRSVLRSGLLVVGALIGAGVAYKGIDAALEWHWNDDGRAHTKEMFENDGLYSWRKLTVTPGLLQIDPSVEFSYDMFNLPSFTADVPEGQILVAQHPIVVKNTILRNIADYPEGAQSDMDRALPSLSPGMLAFYLPGPGDFVYVDVHKNRGLMTSITNGMGVFGSGLGIEDLDITGRELRGGTSYPYTSEDDIIYPPNYDTTNPDQTLKAKEVYQFIGQSMFVGNNADLQNMADGLIYGNWPIQFPST